MTPKWRKAQCFSVLGWGQWKMVDVVRTGGHPECLVGLPRVKTESKPKAESNGVRETVKEEAEDNSEQAGANGISNDQQTAQNDPPIPAGFPDEDDFDHLICYKCVNAFPWIKTYAGSSGFLTAGGDLQVNGHSANDTPDISQDVSESKKRKAEEDPEDFQDSKKAKADSSASEGHNNPLTNIDLKPKHESLPPVPTSNYTTLFLKEDFRDHFCRCPDCFPHLAKHRQLLEEEENYEPPLSSSSGSQNGDGSVAGRSVNSGSLLDRGEAALSSMDRVRAIEGVMAYNHVRDKVKSFLQPFAESGQPVGAEDIKAYFAKLRGDEQAMREAAVGAGSGGVEGDYRREQGGY